LLIDADGDFTDGFVQSIEAASFAGNLVTFNNVTFSGDDIFSLGTSKVGIGPGGVAANLVTWLRADEGTSTTTDNTTLATWTDQGAAANSATQDGNPPLFR